MEGSLKRSRCHAVARSRGEHQHHLWLPACTAVVHCKRIYEDISIWSSDPAVGADRGGDTRVHRVLPLVMCRLNTEAACSMGCGARGKMSSFVMPAVAVMIRSVCHPERPVLESRYKVQVLPCSICSNAVGAVKVSLFPLLAPVPCISTGMAKAAALRRGGASEGRPGPSGP